MAKKPDTHDRIIENRKARHDFHILDTLECGIILRGSEVKSVRDGHVSIAEGWVRAEEQPPSLHVHGMNIEPYGPAGPRQHAPKRTRPLLAHTSEILKLLRQTEEKGYTLVPLKLYFKNGYAKLLIGLAQGKTKGDKRHAIAERDAKREMQRAVSKRLRGGRAT